MKIENSAGRSVKKRMKIRKSFGDWVFSVINVLLMTLLTVSVILPFWDLAVESLNQGYAAGMNRLWPVRPTLSNYAHVLSNRFIFSGYRETLIITVCGTLMSIVSTVIGAYSLSKPLFPFRKLFTLMIVIPMFFSGGLIPTYLWNVQLGLRNTRWVLMLPGLISSYNLVVMRNFFSGVPPELEESAYIDGANNIQIKFRVYRPVSLAVRATVTLWVLVSYWNSWFDATIYITRSDRFPLQVVLRRIILEGTNELMDLDSGSNVGSMDNIKAATIFICMLPIMCVYPFLQKYFMKGTLVGAIKG